MAPQGNLDTSTGHANKSQAEAKKTILNNRSDWSVPIKRWSSKTLQVLSVPTFGQSPHAACAGLR